MLIIVLLLDIPVMEKATVPSPFEASGSGPEQVAAQINKLTDQSLDSTRGIEDSQKAAHLSEENKHLND